MKENPIPAGYPSWNTFTALHVKSQENLKELLEELLQQKSKSSELSVDEHKVATFYAASLNEDAIEADGVAVLQPVLDLIQETVIASESNDRAAKLGEFPKRFGLMPFFGISASPDNKNSLHTLCQLSQGGLGLPDRDYYFDDDKADKRDAYKKHVAFMLTLLQDTTAKEATEQAVAQAQAIYDLEVKLAEAHMTKTENRDPEATYNKMSVSELTEKLCENKFDFAAYLKSATNSKELGEINVRNVAALQRVAEVVASIDIDTMQAYLTWKALRSLAPYLSKAFVDANFDFYENILSGTAEIKPRWKRAMAFTEDALGEVLGQLYCAKHFDESCKERAVHIVQSVRKALEERLLEVDWMTSDSTRESALKKMAAFSCPNWLSRQLD